MQPMELTFNVCDAAGNAVSQAGGWGSVDISEGRRIEHFEIQSAEELPEALILEILDLETLAPVCRIPVTVEPVA